MFKIGDRVRLTEKYGRWSQGHESKVKRIESIVATAKDELRRPVSHLIHTDSGIVCFNSRLELVSPVLSDQELADEYRKFAADNIKRVNELKKRGFTFYTKDGRTINFFEPASIEIRKVEHRTISL